MIDLEVALKGYGQTKQISQGEIIFHLGEDANVFYLLLSGFVNLYKLNLEGKQTIIRRVNAGEIFAEVMVFTDSKYPVGAVAATDCQIIGYSKQEIIGAIEKNSELAMFFIRVLSQRCLMLNATIYQLSMQDVLSRLALFLVKYIKDNCLMCKAETGESFNLNISKKEIANILGIAPETLSRNFKKLNQMGIIKVFGKTIIVQDYSKLLLLVEE